MTTPDILPFDDDSYDPRAPQKPGQALLGMDFAYIGQALSVAEFAAYIQLYAFGSVPPDTVVLHHTAVPTLPQWVANEAGMSDTAIRDKRLRQLGHIRDYYRDTLDWSCGPHLFVCDRFIYLFTPMNQVGIHAKWGNSFRAMGRLHYSIGIEVIGNYENAVWPAAVAANVGGAVRALHARLPAIELRALYSDPASKPGMLGSGADQRCAHPERMRFGGIASHRDFNKPGCPGAAITEAYYMGVIAGAAREPLAVHPPAMLRYVVKQACTGGATIRAFPRVNGAVLGRLHAGEEWVGEPIEAQTATYVAGFGSSKVWVRDSAMRCVFSLLLEKVKES